MWKSVNMSQLCSPPTIIHYNLHNDDQNPAMDFPYLCTTSLCLCTFSSPPFPTYHIISPPPSLAKLKQCFLWTKNTNAKDIFFFHTDQSRFWIYVYREYLRDQPLLRRKFMLCIPLWLSRGPGRDRCLDNQKKTAKIIFLNYLSSALYLDYTLK